MYETAKETLMYGTVFWTLWERERVGWFERMALKHVYRIWNESPVQVRCTILDAWGWCTGTTQRDGTERQVGGGFRMGSTCTPVVDSCWCMAKPIQYCKVKKYNKINILKKKENLSKQKMNRNSKDMIPMAKAENRTITTQENKSDQNNNSEKLSLYPS